MTSDIQFKGHLLGAPLPPAATQLLPALCALQTWPWSWEESCWSLGALTLGVGCPGWRMWGKDPDKYMVLVT